MNPQPVGYRSIADLFRYNSGLVLDYMRLGEEQTAWVRQRFPNAYEDALMLDAIVDAIERGDSITTAEIDGVTSTRDLSSLRYDLDLPPEDQFRLLAAPTLALHASEDLYIHRWRTPSTPSAPSGLRGTGMSSCGYFRLAIIRSSSTPRTTKHSYL